MRKAIYDILMTNTLHPNIVSKVNAYQLRGTILGVHVRLTDMNATHGDIYGHVHIEDYIRKINEVLVVHPDITTIYVASDNRESIVHITDMFQTETLRVISNDSPGICNKSDDTFHDATWIRRHGDEEVINQNVFVDILMLSRCTSLIYRISDVANFAIAYSSTLNDFYNLSTPLPRM
jgi:hypothetical protein